MWWIFLSIHWTMSSKFKTLVTAVTIHTYCAFLGVRHGSDLSSTLHAAGRSATASGRSGLCCASTLGHSLSNQPKSKCPSWPRRPRASRDFLPHFISYCPYLGIFPACQSQSALGSLQLLPSLSRNTHSQTPEWWVSLLPAGSSLGLLPKNAFPIYPI